MTKARQEQTAQNSFFTVLVIRLRQHFIATDPAVPQKTHTPLASSPQPDQRCLTEVADLYVDSLNRTLEDVGKPAAFVAAYALLGRIRMISTEAVLKAADRVIQDIIEAYNRPPISIQELKKLTDGDAAEGHGLAAEDVGKTETHLLAPEVGLDDGAEGLVERLIVVGVRKGEALVGLNVGRGEGGGGTGRKDRRNRWRIDEERRRSGGPGGDPFFSRFSFSRRQRWQECYADRQAE
jgi:hypothetical protein